MSPIKSSNVSIPTVLVISGSYLHSIESVTIMNSCSLYSNRYQVHFIWCQITPSSLLPITVSQPFKLCLDITLTRDFLVHLQFLPRNPAPLKTTKPNSIPSAIAFYFINFRLWIVKYSPPINDLFCDQICLLNFPTIMS